MLTKNFYSYMRAALQKTTATFTKTDGSTKSTSIVSDLPPFYVMNSWAKTITSTGVAFGTGTTPATVSDYCLESILDDTNISVTAPSALSYSRGDTFDEYSIGFGVTNITDEAITISEMGIIAMPYGSNSPYTYVLVDRTVLDVPVTIPPHETKHIAYTIRFNYGDAS